MNDRLKEMYVLRKTRRHLEFYPPAIRSKYIAIPNQVVTATNHLITEFHLGKEVNVPTDIGYLHHYRKHCALYKWETRHFSKKQQSKFFKRISQLDAKYCFDAPTKIDRTMWKYKNKLLRQVNQIFQAVSPQCHLFWFLIIDNFVIMPKMQKKYLPLIVCASILLKNIPERIIY